MIYRQKVLLGLLQELGGQLPADKLSLYLFLFCHEFSEHNHYYHFIPTAQGPRSLQMEEDKKYLASKKLLQAAPDWVAVEGIARYASDLNFFEKMGIQQLKNQLATATTEALLARIHEKYPYYAGQAASETTEPQFYTIGYEGKSVEEYVNALIQQGVKLLCDVRKNPISKKFGFSKQELASTLPQVGIEYLHMPELGIVSEKRQNLETAQDYYVLFKEYVATVLPKEQPSLDLLERLLQEKGRIAITCFESNVSHCHRGKIAEALRNRPSFAATIKHL